MKIFFSFIFAFVTSLYAIDERDYVGNVGCKYVLQDDYLTICYDKIYKGPSAVFYMLEENMVDGKNYNLNPDIYIDPKIEKKYIPSYEEFKKSGFEMTVVSPDINTDLAFKDIAKGLLYANIIPQYPPSKSIWRKISDHEKEVVRQMGRLNVLNIVVYEFNPEFAGKNSIFIPSGFVKVLFDKSKNFEECYYYENKRDTEVKESYMDYKIDCESVEKN